MESIEIKTSDTVWEGVTNCNGGCRFFRNASLGCFMNWAIWVNPTKTRTGYVLPYWQPTDKCPGAGKFQLTRVS